MKSENNDDNKNAESRVQVSAGGARRTAARQKNAGSRTRQYRGGSKNRQDKPFRPTAKKTAAKAPAKKTTAKKAAATKPTAKKTTTRKTTARKTAAKKTAAAETTGTVAQNVISGGNADELQAKFLTPKKDEPDNNQPVGIKDELPVYLL